MTNLRAAENVIVVENTLSHNEKGLTHSLSLSFKIRTRRCLIYCMSSSRKILPSPRNLDSVPSSTAQNTTSYRDPRTIRCSLGPGLVAVVIASGALNFVPGLWASMGPQFGAFIKRCVQGRPWRTYFSQRLLHSKSGSRELKTH